jgi:hypothetical protein
MNSTKLESTIENVFYVCSLNVTYINEYRYIHVRLSM